MSASTYVLVQTVFDYAKSHLPLEIQKKLTLIPASIQDISVTDKVTVIGTKEDWKPAYIFTNQLFFFKIQANMIALQDDGIVLEQCDNVFRLTIPDQFTNALTLLRDLQPEIIDLKSTAFEFFSKLEIDAAQFFVLERVVWTSDSDDANTINAAISDAEIDQPVFDVITEAEQNALDEAEAAKTVGRDYFLPTIHEIESIYQMFYGLSRCVKELEIQRVRKVTALKRLIATINQKNAMAVANWDKEGKEPFDPKQPYNNGANDEKRAGIAHALFEDDYILADQIQAEIDQLDEQLLEPKKEKELAQIEIQNIELILVTAKEARLNGIKLTR